MESSVRNLLVLYKAVIVFILSVIMEAFEVLHDDATEEWYTQRDLGEVEREERNCMRLARHLRKEYSERFFTYVLFHPSTRSVAAHLDSYLLHVYYTSELDNLHDDKGIDQLELDWITWQRDYTLNKTWGDSRTSILEAMHANCKF